ncbi:hypothetical protein [Streptomyces sp. AA1529]|uniref:hypothetical protein n=1 Tax=Streptomyces sp. AA1529 TaxID=1203257 RepID=UPI0003099C6B|nr:hypothetical protein [Streptomyces sp. AA1529]
MRKNRVIGAAAAAVVALGLSAGAVTTAAAFSGGDGTGSAQPAEQSDGFAPAGKSKAGSGHGDMPGGVAVQRTEDGMKIRKLTEEEQQDSHGAKPTKPLTDQGGAGEEVPDK